MWCFFWKNEIFESSCEQNSPENEDLEKVNMQWMWSTLWEKTFHKGLLVGSDSRKTSCLKIIPTRPLRHVWPEVVMENHTHTPAVHGKSHSLDQHMNKVIFKPYEYNFFMKTFFIDAHLKSHLIRRKQNKVV